MGLSGIQANGLGLGWWLGVRCSY